MNTMRRLGQKESLIAVLNKFGTQINKPADEAMWVLEKRDGIVGKEL